MLHPGFDPPKTQNVFGVNAPFSFTLQSVRYVRLYRVRTYHAPQVQITEKVQYSVHTALAHEVPRLLHAAVRYFKPWHIDIQHERVICVRARAPSRSRW